MELPYQSPWRNQMRLSGIDFLEDRNKAVICSTDGDVWLVEGVLQSAGKLTWKRIASGLFQPLGIKIVNKEIYFLRTMRLKDFYILIKLFIKLKM